MSQTSGQAKRVRCRFVRFLALTAAWSSALVGSVGQGWAQPVSPGAPPTPTSTASPGEPSASGGKVEYALVDGTVIAVRDGARTRLGIDGPVVAILHAGNLLYVARGPRGASVYHLAQPLVPALVREIPFAGGAATGFHVTDGQVWVVVSSRKAVPIDEAAIAPVTAPATPTRVGPMPAKEATKAGDAASLERPQIEILRIGPGDVELAAGAERGVRVGDKYVIVRPTRVERAEGEGFTGEKVITVAEVIAVNSRKSLADLGRSVRVRPGDFARRARQSEIDGSELSPREPNVAEAFMVLRPLINVGTPLGVGFLADLGATYWGNAYFLGLRVQPFGIGFNKHGNIVSTAALVEGGYEASAFAVGLGLGVGWVNGDMDYMLNSFGSAASDEKGTTDQVTVTERQETHTAFALSQVARLGSRDGLHVVINNLLLLHKRSTGGDTGFIYGGTTGRLVVPTGRRTDFFAEGGGGVMGYWFFGIGAGSWIVGNGSPGSWYVSASAGAAGIRGSREITETYQTQSYTYTDDISIAGPMVSVGVTRRFGFW